MCIIVTLVALLFVRMIVMQKTQLSYSVTFPFRSRNPYILCNFLLFMSHAVMGPSECRNVVRNK